MQVHFSEKVLMIWCFSFHISKKKFKRIKYICTPNSGKQKYKFTVLPVIGFNALCLQTFYHGFFTLWNLTLFLKIKFQSESFLLSGWEGCMCEHEVYWSELLLVLEQHIMSQNGSSWRPWFEASFTTELSEDGAPIQWVLISLKLFRQNIFQFSSFSSVQ